MLTPQQIQGVANDITSIYSNVESECIKSIVKAIKKGDKLRISSATQWQMKKMADIGWLKKDLIQAISVATKKSVGEVNTLVLTALQESAYTDNKVYEQLKHYRGTSKAEFIEKVQNSESFQRVLKNALAGVKDTLNITGTKALQGSISAYSNAINTAFLSMTTGNATYEDAVKKAVEQIGKSGIKIVDSKGKVTDNELVKKNGELYTTYTAGNGVRVYPLDSAIRRDIVTQVNQASAELTLEDCKKLDCTLVETSWHNGARPEHEVWQGQVFTLDPKDTRYGYFYGSLEAGLPAYGTALGICGINCYHSFSPFPEGAPHSDTTGKLSAEENAKQYAQQQKQRAYERNLRGLKREQIAYREAGMSTEAQAVQKKINSVGTQYRQFLSDTGLTRVSMLDSVSGYHPVSTTKTVATTPTATQIPNTSSTQTKRATRSINVVPDKLVKFDYIDNRHEEARKHLFDKQWQTLTADEQDSIHTYTTNAYYKMNKILRGLEPHTSYYDNLNDLTKKGLAKCRLDDNYQFYRGVDFDTFENVFKISRDDLMTKEGIENLVGRTYEDKGFSSTGITYGKGWDRDIKMTIIVPKGTNGLYVSPISQFPSEDEVLLQAGQKFKILEAEPRSDKHGLWVKLLAIK